MSRVAIFGANSRLGQELVSAALRWEFLINAVVLDARKMTRQHEAITTIQVDLSTGKGLDAAVSGCHFVIWAITSRRSIVADWIAKLAPELSHHRVPKRLVFISRIAVLSKDRAPSRLWGAIRSLFGVPGTSLDDLGRAEAILKTGAVTHVIVRPAGLSDGGGKHRLIAVGPQDPVPGPTSRAELADFILGMLDEDVWNRGEIIVGSTS